MTAELARDINDPYTTFVDNDFEVAVSWTSYVGDYVHYRKTRRGTDPRCSAKLPGPLIAATRLQVYDTSIVMGAGYVRSSRFHLMPSKELVKDLTLATSI